MTETDLSLTVKHGEPLHLYVDGRKIGSITVHDYRGNKVRVAMKLPEVIRVLRHKVAQRNQARTP